MNENDMALEALLKAAEVDSSVSADLLKKTFAIQRRHQFDREDVRETSMQDLKALLDAIIEEGDVK